MGLYSPVTLALLVLYPMYNFTCGVIIKKGKLSHRSSAAIMLNLFPSSEKTRVVQFLIEHILNKTKRDVKNVMDNNGVRKIGERNYF